MKEKSSTAGLDLLTLQGKIKRDPEGHQEDFLLQYRHYKACLNLFQLNPSKESREFADLVKFLAQVSSCYPEETGTFHAEISKLLEEHYAVLEPSLCRSLVQSLILLRNRGQVTSIEQLPLFFRLFRCNSKQLRQLLHRHIISDIKASNQKHRDDKLNRSVQNFLYGMLQDEHEAAAKKSLAVLTELYRRNIWRDAKTVNVIASAVLHKSSAIMLAAVKFFLGQDEREENEEEEEGDGPKVEKPTAKDFYNATKKGTASTKKKKEKRLKRAMAAVKKQETKSGNTPHESFSAIQLLHDPQSFAEKLFARLRGSHERWDTRLALMQLISRVIGIHSCLVLNFYPFLQKYITPHQQDETQILAALVQACHEMVPPETMQPVLRQIVDQFVHDRARPEVMTIGIKTVREICSRMPLVINEELLQELAEYKKDRDKPVATAARSLISLFRELCPTMLVKKDRGRGADLERQRDIYGAAHVRDRIDGAELLEEAIKRGEKDSEEEFSEDEEEASDGEGLEAGGDKEHVEDDEDVHLAASDNEEDGGTEVSDDEEAGVEAESGDEEAESGDEEAESGDEEAESGGEEDEGGSEDGEEQGEEEAEEECDTVKSGPKDDSLRALKAMAKAKSKAKAEEQKQAETQQGATNGNLPLEMGRILTQEDFDRIKRLKHKQLVEVTMEKHGLKSSKRKMDNLRAKAEEDADHTLEFMEARATLSQTRVDPDSLLGKHKKRKSKEERLASVLEGRKDRDGFGSSTGRKKQKQGGTSNKEKNKMKNIPIAARLQAIRRRAKMNHSKGSKNFRGRKAYHT